MNGFTKVRGSARILYKRKLTVCIHLSAFVEFCFLFPPKLFDFHPVGFGVGSDFGFGFVTVHFSLGVLVSFLDFPFLKLFVFGSRKK